MADTLSDTRSVSSAPPTTSAGPLSWLKKNLFSTPTNSLLTVLTLAVLAWIVPLLAADSTPSM